MRVWALEIRLLQQVLRHAYFIAADVSGRQAESHTAVLML